ncbi:MAG: hypothetical protein KME11_16355 [Timaviella obliquedivisa GSE-PSE-MK23-08B]|jgi:hypothetical protein|nr:hypothetical protein [Timaviella obliquedivisa GSE-PSE-MK23-08B]
MNIQSVQLDPLNSPHPIPWTWVTSIALGGGFAPGYYGYYRSQSLLSPNRDYAAYSRIQVQPAAHFTQSRVVSALFLENLRTGNLQTIMASSPFADSPFRTSESEQAGTIAVLIPIAWSETGDRLLAREFEAIFGSSVASDFAVVWDSRTNQTQTLAPSRINYSNAVLMGWSQTHPEQVLFQAGMVGDPHWNFYTVKTNGQTQLAEDDRPITYGQVMTNIWAGPQAYRCL